MNLRFANPIIFPTNLQKSKSFYKNTLGLSIVQDTENFILFEGNFGIHGNAKEFWSNVFDKPQANPPFSSNNSLLLYFQTEAIEETFKKLATKINLIHPLKKEPWGERVFRFYDPDDYILEMGEAHYSTEEG